MSVHYPEGRFIYECDYCGKKFSRKYTLSVHLNHHQRRRISVKKQMLTMHENVQTINCLCAVCGKGYSTPSLLADHITSHENREALQIKCDICGKLMKNRRTLRQHGKMHKNKPRKCPHCGKLEYCMRDLKTHISQFHANHKHQCSYCSKSFRRPTQLKVCLVNTRNLYSSFPSK